MEDAASDSVGNLPEFSVGEISLAVKRTVESNFERVRVRGEVSRPMRAGSGHVYLTLKDENAVLDAVCWRGAAQRLSIQPEDGMEVIATGKLTTYPGRSKYQMVIEQMELAGEGALLKLLEDRRKRLAAEGLFEAERKRPIPFLPSVIGVVTSPTGAVIRDILHRLADRFPVHVIVWPVLVQGDGAKDQVSRAIRGFNSLPEQGGPMPRPDLLIVARGGGSLEDLWAFNEEEVVRAAAASDIPLISAVGHETDTTLIDFASDRRAPTPSAAAEMAVPVRADLIARLAEDTARLTGAVSRRLNEGRTVVSGLARGLGDPGARIEQAQQRLDYASGTSRSRITALLDRLKYAVDRPIPSPAEILARTRGRFDTVARGLRVGPIERSIADGDRDLARLLRGARSAYGRRLKSEEDRLAGLGKLLDANSFERVLERGFALVRDESGAPVKSAAETSAGQTVSLRFRDGETSAVIGTGPAPADGGGGAKPKARAKPAPASPPDTPTQETLF
ncbi:exodeoxyribonuclease VII large subunit [Thalassobaculum salexigens]|uniref:exodeoxyribonuclease VII large subunit n=1 Tax=Thalassobaculum salexigens TaxID=455360 RepID=UPI000406C832|nr:exodeoxyribonuclease VII large subunit [Thalassobaculum salexigens]